MIHMKDVDELTKKIIVFRDVRDWKQFHNPKDLALSLVLEATEVMEHFQWKNKEEVEEHIRTSKPDIAEELADVLYWVLLMSHDLGIDILRALDKKIMKNGKRFPILKVKGKHSKYDKR